MFNFDDLAASGRGLLGTTKPPRPIAKQNDSDREELVEATGGTPVMNVGAYSVGESTPFLSYLNADVLHTLQQPRSDGRDEMTFICMAHIMEIHFKLLSHEGLAAQDALRRDALEEASAVMVRMRRALEHLTSVWDVLGTIKPQGYLEYRDYLGIGSGFESYMYRRLEFALGNKQPSMLTPHQHVPEAHLLLRQALESPSLYDDAIALLARHGLQIDDHALDRDWSQPYHPDDSVRAAWLQIYRERTREDELFLLGEDLMAIAEQFAVWRYRHFISVRRLIGYKPGTGGTSGVGWLRHIVDHTFFPELWEIRTEL